MANSIPGTYKQVSFIKNSSEDLQKLLKSVFLLGPSKAVLNKGNVIVSSSRVAQDSDDQSSDQNNGQSQSGNNQSNNAESPVSNVNSSDENSSSESYNYSVFEALSFLRYNKIYEDDNDDTSSSDKAQSEESSAEDNDKSNQKEDSESDHEFADTDLEVVVNLPNEGCTKWHIRLSNVTDKDKVINALKSKKFKAAFDIANSQAAKIVQGDQSAEGITVLSATTMIDKKKEYLAPFIGRCRWAFDVGSEDNNEESFDLEIAIAPIDGKSKKPKESTIYHTVFNIVGDITNGRLKGFDKFVKAKDFLTGNEDSDSDDASEMLHKWLQSNFKCVGDSSMYDEFIKVRKFVEDNLKKKTIEPSKEESSSIASYILTIKSAKSFISF